MKEDGEESLFELLGAKNAVQILEFLDQHGVSQYKDMMNSFNTYTLNERLRGLLSFGLVEHHFERTETRKEWYELTERGKKILRCVHELKGLLRLQ